MEPSPLPSRSTKPRKHGVLPGAAIPQPPQNGLPTPRKPIPHTEALGEAEALELADIHFEPRFVHPRAIDDTRDQVAPVAGQEKGGAAGYVSPDRLDAGLACNSSRPPGGPTRSFKATIISLKAVSSS